jgi:hypothetical protein
MPKPLLSAFGKRQPRALVVGLRLVVKDPKATVAQRLEACKLLAIVEGYIPPHPRDHIQAETETAGKAQDVSSRPPMAAKNANRLRELLDVAQIEKPETGLLGSRSSELQQ